VVIETQQSGQRYPRKSISVLRQQSAGFMGLFRTRTTRIAITHKSQNGKHTLPSLIPRLSGDFAAQIGTCLATTPDLFTNASTRPLISSVIRHPSSTTRVIPATLRTAINSRLRALFLTIFDGLFPQCS
jgi:hypothetical protein